MPTTAQNKTWVFDAEDTLYDNFDILKKIVAIFLKSSEIVEHVGHKKKQS